MANPTPAYDNWQHLLRSDVGVDPVAVARDFPRMVVFVATETENNYTRSRGGSTVIDIDDDSGARGSSPTPQGHAEGSEEDVRTVNEVLADRSEAVRRTTMLLASLCGESDTYGAAFDAAWQGACCRSEESYSDVTGLMLTALVESSMFCPVADDARGVAPAAVIRGSEDHSVPAPEPTPLTGSGATACAAESKKLTASRTHGYGATNEQSDAAATAQTRLSPEVSRRTKKVSYRVQGKTAHLLLYLVQGTMFFPSQRLRHLLWLPWSSHLQDVSWTVHVYARDAEDGSMAPCKEICIVQKQTTRHYVEQRDLRVTPQFEVDWECFITVERENPQQLREAQLSVAAARVSGPMRALCFVSRTWKKRRAELGEHLEKQFGIGIDDVPHLRKRSVQRL